MESYFNPLAGNYHPLLSITVASVQSNTLNRETKHASEFLEISQVNGIWFDRSVSDGRLIQNNKYAWIRTETWRARYTAT